MRVIVTGASGFIGRHLVSRLRGDGMDLVLPGRAELALDETALAAFCGHADAVVHLAARAHKKNRRDDAALFHAENVVLTRKILALAARAGARHLVFLSSIGVLGQATRGRPLDESTPCHPETPYARSKLQAETDIMHFCSEHDIKWTILRPPLIYGANAPGNIGLLQKLIRRGLPLPFGAVRNRRSLVGIDNLTDLIAFCLMTPEAHDQIYNLGDGVDRSTPELLHLLAAIEGRPLKLWRVPVWLLRLGAALTGQSRRLAPLWQDLQVDNGKLHRQLHWQVKK